MEKVHDGKFIELMVIRVDQHLLHDNSIIWIIEYLKHFIV